MKKQTVLLFNSIYPQITGGMEVYNYHLSQHLLTDEYPDIIMLTSVSSLVDNERVFRINDRLFGMRRFGLGMLSVFISCILSPHIHIRKWKCVMIPHTSNFEYMAWPVLLFSRLYGFKYVIHCHGGGARLSKTRLQKRLFNRASHIGAVSQKIIDEYHNNTGCTIEYLPPLMDFEKSSLTKEEIKRKFGLNYDRIILFVGSLKPLKSPETLLKAFTSLPADWLKAENIGLVLAGGGALLGSLKSNYSDNERICLLGQVKNEMVKELYSVADLFVISSWFEGTPLALMEAMYNGICCIGTKVQGIDTILKDGFNGFLFPKDDYKSLCELIKRCFNDESLMRSIGQSADDYYHSKFSYDTHLKQVLDLLEYYTDKKSI